jgi:hypothetical protein
MNGRYQYEITGCGKYFFIIVDDPGNEIRGMILDSIQDNKTLYERSYGERT